jgi:hypothetical protein
MPLFVQREGVVEMHASDCETCDWSQGTRSEPETDIEEIIAKAAGCSLVHWQSMTEEEGDKKLKKACKARAKQLKKKRKKEAMDVEPEEPEEQKEREYLPPLKVQELPSNYTWRVPSKQDLLDTQAAWIVHQNQERRKEILERASAKMAEAMTKANALMREAIEMLTEM